MPLWLKSLFLVGSALDIFLFAMVFAPSSRGYGGPGGWGAGLLYALGAILLAGGIFWSFLTWLIYRSQQNRTRGQRIGITLLFFLAPLILVTVSIGLDSLKESLSQSVFDAHTK